MAMKLSLMRHNNRLEENGLTITEQSLLYDAQLQDVIDNPRWYLDNFHRLREYRVGWWTYSPSGGHSLVTPRYCHVKKRKNTMIYKPLDPKQEC
jgi:hypothetical protein